MRLRNWGLINRWALYWRLHIVLTAAKDKLCSLVLICWRLGAERLWPHMSDVGSELGHSGQSPPTALIMVKCSDNSLGRCLRLCVAWILLWQWPSVTDVQTHWEVLGFVQQDVIIWVSRARSSCWVVAPRKPFTEQATGSSGRDTNHWVDNSA